MRPGCPFSQIYMFKGETLLWPKRLELASDRQIQIGVGDTIPDLGADLPKEGKCC